MLSKGCSYVAQKVQTELYVDIMAEKLIRTVSRKGTRQWNKFGSKMVSRRCPRRENAQNMCRGRTHGNGTRAAARKCRDTVATEKNYKRMPHQENLVRPKYCVSFFDLGAAITAQIDVQPRPPFVFFLLTQNSS
jgi:hypothetical protein